MEKYIARSAETKEPILANEICYWYAFDIMSHMAYGKSFGMLDEGQWHHIVQKELGALQLLGPFSPVMWLARLGLRFFPGLWRMRDWHEMTAFGRDQICRRINVRRGELLITPVQLTPPRTKRAKATLPHI